MNLSYKNQKWYAYYKGYVYTNAPTDIHAAINNKAAIDKMLEEKFK